MRNIALNTEYGFEIGVMYRYFIWECAHCDCSKTEILDKAEFFELNRRICTICFMHL